MTTNAANLTSYLKNHAAVLLLCTLPAVKIQDQSISLLIHEREGNAIYSPPSQPDFAFVIAVREG